MGEQQKITMQQWEQTMQQAHIDKDAMNRLVMNWLVVEGYQNVAEQFQQETATKSSVPLSSISARTSVRAAISQGRVEEALAQINSMLPTLFERNPGLLLQLQQQQLVELIRGDKVAEALNFARSHLRAACAADPAALHSLECILSLLAFSALPPAHNPMAHLLDQRARTALASAVNDAILEGQFACKESQLQRCAKQTIHAQQKLAQYSTAFPKLPMDSWQAAASSIGSATGGASVTSAASSFSTPSFSSSLLDPISVFESLAQTEASARRVAEEKAAAEMSTVISALERERAMREERLAARRATQAAAAAARAANPRAAAAAARLGRQQQQQQQQLEDDDEEEERQQQLQQHALQHQHQHAAHSDEEDPEEEEEGEDEDDEEEEEDQNMAAFV